MRERSWETSRFQHLPGSSFVPEQTKTGPEGGGCPTFRLHPEALHATTSGGKRTRSCRKGEVTHSNVEMRGGGELKTPAGEEAKRLLETLASPLAQGDRHLVEEVATGGSEGSHCSGKLTVLLPHLQLHLRVFHSLLSKMSPKATT